MPSTSRPLLLLLYLLHFHCSFCSQPHLRVTCVIYICMISKRRAAAMILTATAFVHSLIYQPFACHIALQRLKSAELRPRPTALAAFAEKWQTARKFCRIYVEQTCFVVLQMSPNTPEFAADKCRCLSFCFQCCNCIFVFAHIHMHSSIYVSNCICECMNSNFEVYLSFFVVTTKADCRWFVQPIILTSCRHCYYVPEFFALLSQKIIQICLHPHNFS